MSPIDTNESSSENHELASDRVMTELLIPFGTGIAVAAVAIGLILLFLLALFLIGASNLSI